METHKTHQSLWQRIGGGSLTTAIVFHILLLIIGALFVFHIKLPEAKKPDFLPESGGGRDNASEVKTSAKRQARPSTNVSRIAVDVESLITITREPLTNLGLIEKFSAIDGGPSGTLDSGQGPGLGGGPGGPGKGSSILPHLSANAAPPKTACSASAKPVARPNAKWPSFPHCVGSRPTNPQTAHGAMPTKSP
jgi:hypothetical protein